MGDSEVHDVVGDATIEDLAVLGLDEAVVVQSGEGRKVTDQTDVRAFWRFNRVHTAAVLGAHVSDFEARTLTTPTTRAHSRKTTLMRQTRQRLCWSMNCDSCDVPKTP